MNERRCWRLVCVAVLALGLVACDGQAPPAALGIDRVLGAPAADPGYARATTPRRFDFPADHAAHPDFRHEWWYFTGHLREATGRGYGFQLTLFRFAIAPTTPPSRSAWRTREVLLGHFALSDLGGGRFHAHERRARAALGLAGFEREPAAVWVGDWRIALVDPAAGAWRLEAREAGLGLALELRPRKPPALPGDAGLSQKSAAPGNATYYYAVSRLDAAGTLAIGDREVEVEGSAWLDREWGTSALGPDQVGWDWFALQLDDGTEVTYYQLRLRDGTPDAHSQGLHVARDGTTRRLVPEGPRSARAGVDEPPGPASGVAAQPVGASTPTEAGAKAAADASGAGAPRSASPAATVQLTVTDRWRSPNTGIDYPAGWRIEIPGHGLALSIEPLLAAQEWDGTFRYWEGAVTVRGTRADRAITGRGYVELTGYDR